VELIDLWHSIANASLTLRKYRAYLKNWHGPHMRHWALYASVH
jgi:hypothetical protein